MSKDTSWMHLAKCHINKIDPNYFFPGTSDLEYTRDKILTEVEEERARYCHGFDDNKPCMMKQKCLEYAMENRVYGGVYGGTSHSQRIKLRKRKIA